MPRNGSGTFNFITNTAYPAVDGVTLLSADWNAFQADVGTALTGSIAADGQTPMSGNLQMGNNRVTGMAAAVAITDAANANDVQSGRLQYLTAVAGTNTVTASLTGFTAYAAGQTFRYIQPTTNTGAVTLNINSIGAKSITKTGTVPLGASDIPTGALVEVVYDGTQFQLQNYMLTPLGQARLTKSGANLLLSPFKGNRLTIGGLNQAIPSAGVTLAASGLTPGTSYYIYAFMNAGTMTLEASATTHATDANTGVEIKTGDATRTLVGLARVITGPAWQDTAAQRFVISYFNRRPIFGSANLTTARTTGSPTYTEINTEIRCEWLTWADSAVQLSISGSQANTGANNTFTSIGIDSTTVAEDVMSLSSFNANVPIGLSIPVSPAEGYHFSAMLGAVAAGTGTWGAPVNSAGTRTVQKVVIQG